MINDGITDYDSMTMIDRDEPALNHQARINSPYESPIHHHQPALNHPFNHPITITATAQAPRRQNSQHTAAAELLTTPAPPRSWESVLRTRACAAASWAPWADQRLKNS